MEAAGQQSQRTEKTDFGKLTGTVTFFIILILREKKTELYLISLLQEIKKETKSLEVLNEKLDFIQQSWQTQGVFRDVQTQVMCSVWVHVSLVSHICHHQWSSMLD